MDEHGASYECTNEKLAKYKIFINSLSGGFGRLLDDGSCRGGRLVDAVANVGPCWNVARRTHDEEIILALVLAQTVLEGRAFIDSLAILRRETDADMVEEVNKASGFVMALRGSRRQVKVK